MLKLMKSHCLGTITCYGDHCHQLLMKSSFLKAGLSGSSAIVCAALNCLLDFYGVRHLVKVDDRPNLILSAEGELGITAGLQDRVAQVYGGLVYMDFSKEYMDKMGHGLYTPMDPNLLPQMHLIYAENPSDSGKIHNAVRKRWLDGDELIRSSIAEVAELPPQGLAALLEKDYSKLAKLMDHNFDLRRASVDCKKKKHLVVMHRDDRLQMSASLKLVSMRVIKKKTAGCCLARNRIGDFKSEVYRCVEPAAPLEPHVGEIPRAGSVMLKVEPHAGSSVGWEGSRVGLGAGREGPREGRGDFWEGLAGGKPCADQVVNKVGARIGEESFTELVKAEPSPRVGSPVFAKKREKVQTGSGATSVTNNVTVAGASMLDDCSEEGNRSKEKNAQVNVADQEEPQVHKFLHVQRGQVGDRDRPKADSVYRRRSRSRDRRAEEFIPLACSEGDGSVRAIAGIEKGLPETPSQNELMAVDATQGDQHDQEVTGQEVVMGEEKSTHIEKLEHLNTKGNEQQEARDDRGVGKADPLPGETARTSVRSPIVQGAQSKTSGASLIVT
eukprot:Gb_22991 [translate_table: standard]